MPENDQANSDSNKAESKDKNASHSDSPLKFRPIGKRAALIGGIMLGALALVSIFAPNMTERIKFFTVNALSVLVLLAIAVQAYIYRKQWEAMDTQAGTMQEQLAAMKAQEGAMKGQLTAMQESLAETRNMVRQNERAVAASEAQAAASQAMVEAAAESFYVSEQPYIALEKIRFVTPMSAGRPLNIELIYRNCGRTPAFNFVGFSQITVSDQPASEALKTYPVKEVARDAIGHDLAPNLPQRMTLVSDADFLNQKRFDAITDGPGRLYIFLRARYRDFRQTEKLFSIDLMYLTAENRFCQAEEYEYPNQDSTSD